MNSRFGKRLDMIGALIFLIVAVVALVSGWILAMMGAFLAIIAFLVSWFYWDAIENRLMPLQYSRAIVAFLAFFAIALMLAEVAR